MTSSPKDVTFLCFADACHSGGSYAPKNYFTVLIDSFKPNRQNVLKNTHDVMEYYIDSNQLLHNDKDQQMLIVGGPNTRTTN